MEHSTSLISRMMNHAEEGILVYGNDGRIHFANDAVFNLLCMARNAKPTYLSEIKHCDLSFVLDQTGLAQAGVGVSGSDRSLEQAAIREVKLNGRSRSLKLRSEPVYIPGAATNLRALMIQAGQSKAELKCGSASGAVKVVAQDPAMLQLLARIEHIAGTDASVLLQGESGTGKTQIARFIHERSRRSRFPFVEVSCAAIAESLIESELFGHVKGAFTNAVENRVGRFEMANQGTLFLDEIAEIPFSLQSKLLKALQDQMFERVGSNSTLQVNTRIISATNLDLKSAVQAETFRSDLFYRLSVIPIRIPSLRERPGDIPVLIEHFLRQNVSQGCYPDCRFTPAALQRLQDYHWPGNVRELANAVQHGLICATSNVMDVDCLPPDVRQSSGPDSGPHLVEVDSQSDCRLAIVSALNACAGNRTRAADKLGINRSTLWRRMKRFGIEAG